MIASLGMYDMPHLQDVHDRYWSAIRQALGHGPDHLTRGRDPWAEWTSPDLLLAQTCGLPFRARLHDKVTLVGTPDYDLPDCPPGYYFSYLIRRRDDDRDLKELAEQGVMAFNDGLSQSGWAAPVGYLADKGLAPCRTEQSHAHHQSILSVFSENADFAAIDAVTWVLWSASDPRAAAELEAFARTDPTPGLPYVTARHRHPAPIAAAIRTAIASLDPADRTALRLKGLVQIPAADYLAHPIPPKP